MPIIGANVETLTEEEFNKVFSEPKFPILIGKSLYDRSQKIHLDVNKLIPSHIGIFGNTGSGKSNTLSKILKEYINIIKNNSFDNSKILIFDLNNEYGGNAITSLEDKKIFKPTTRREMNEEDKIPFNYNELTYEEMGVILNATEKTQMPVIKKAFDKFKSEWTDESNNNVINAIKNMLVNKDYYMFFLIRKYLGDKITGISDIKYHYKANAFYYDANSFINEYGDIRDISFSIQPDNRLERFEVELIMQIISQSESGTNFEFVSPLLARMENRKNDFKKIFKNSTTESYNDLFSENNIVVMQLANVNKDTREIIPSLFSKKLYDSQKEEKDDTEIKSILNIVIDEAHNLLSKDEENPGLHSNTLKVFEELIKEGRKFGVYLLISSQRPSDISNTITSQLHNYFIHKLVNPNDIEKIRKTVSFMSDITLNMLTMLGQGECIVSGVSLYMPQYVCVDELDDENKPYSNDVILLGEKGILKSEQDNRNVE